MLPHSQAEEWRRLDKQLDCAYFQLKIHYHDIPALPPINPWAFGYLRPHPNRRALSLCLEKSRQWFGVWFALLSNMIAESEELEMCLVKDRVLARQNWKNVLIARCVDAQIDAAWIDLFLDTTVALFSPHVWRTGAFIYITPGDPYLRETRVQRNVEWFVTYDVPVWYRWDKEAASLRENQHLAPLEFQLQQTDSFMRKSPSPLLSDTSPAVNNDDNLPVVNADDPPISTVKMDAFFKLREEQTARLMARETPKQYADRHSREGQHPTVNTRVFEWTANGDGEFVREEIMTKPRRREVLGEYRGKQRRYNAVLNEWHLCELWDHFEDLDEDSDDYFPFSFEGVDDPPNSPTNMRSYGDNSLLDDVWTPEQGTSENRQALQLQEEILHVATLYFGYTPLVALPKVDMLKTEQERKAFCRCFGLIWKQVEPIQEVFTFPAVAAVIDFFRRLANNANMLHDEWDLLDKNQQSILRSPRFGLFRPVISTLVKEDRSKKEIPLYTFYMLELGPKATAPWRLAVKSASDALMICRLDLAFNEYDIVDFLLTNGIAFHTLQPLETLLQTPDIPRNLTPHTRENGYTFSTCDYLAYREHCHTILNHPRGRAALMHGHFMWRIAFRSVMREAVYNGPSGWSTDTDEMVVVRDPSTGRKFIDDKLSTVEQLALSGTYHCLTGELFNPTNQTTD